MTLKEEQNISWLAMALSLPISYIGEVCYYDKRDKQLFILTSLDHILINEKLKPYWVNDYTVDQEAFLTGMLTRMESSTDEFISIPRLETDVRMNIQGEFIADLGSTIHYNELMQVVATQDGTTTFMLTAYLSNHNELHYLLNEWQNYLANELSTYAKEVAALNDLDLSVIELYHIDPAGRAMTKVGTSESLQDAESVAKQKKKPWWKVW